jgi:hypothetical protein
MMLQAWEQCRVDGIVGLGMVPTWSMASTAWVGEDGGAYGELERGRE